MYYKGLFHDFVDPNIIFLTKNKIFDELKSYEKIAQIGVIPFWIY